MEGGKIAESDRPLSSILHTPSSLPPLRYAVLWHSDIDQPHYDLMFETSPGSALATWRSAVWPMGGVTEIIRLRDHRAAFLRYQGLLSQDRGTVTQVALGECHIHFIDLDHWIISWPGGSVPKRLRLQKVQDEHWRAEPLAD